MKKGALVEFMSAFGTSVPNVIVFQYNPESLRHSLAPSTPPAGPTGQAASNPFAVAGVPTETFSFTISMDVTDQLADPDPAARLEASGFGIYSRLAALEMLMFPSTTPAQSGGTGTQGTGTSGGTGGTTSGDSDKRPTPAAVVAPVLFVWGTGRILPVRVSSLSITEKLYDSDLNPTHADAQLELRVLTPTELKPVPGALGQIAIAAYNYSQGLRVVRAASNLGDSARAVIGMLGDNNLLG